MNENRILKAMELYDGEGWPSRDALIEYESEDGSLSPAERRDIEWALGENAPTRALLTTVREEMNAPMPPDFMDRVWAAVDRSKPGRPESVGGLVHREEVPPRGDVANDARLAGWLERFDQSLNALLLRLGQDPSRPFLQSIGDPLRDWLREASRRLQGGGTALHFATKGPPTQGGLALEERWSEAVERLRLDAADLPPEAREMKELLVAIGQELDRLPSGVPSDEEGGNRCAISVPRRDAARRPDDSTVAHPCASPNPLSAPGIQTLTHPDSGNPLPSGGEGRVRGAPQSGASLNDWLLAGAR